MNDYEILVKTLYLEGGSTLNRTTSIEDILAIAWNIRNRVEKRRYGTRIADVCLKRKQYSCWNNRKPEDIKIGHSFAWDVCQIVARWIMRAEARFNPVEGATHYFNPALCSPRWAKKMKKIPFRAFLNHDFYEEE